MLNALFVALEHALLEKLEEAGVPDIIDKAHNFLWFRSVESLHDLLLSTRYGTEHVEQDVIGTLRLFLNLYDGTVDKTLFILQKEFRAYLGEEVAIIS